ncbi:uncharacterized protein LOC119569500 [Penaeus monodon]|uniref:uncharacterized protein LOC119569500 n=1 Tax=Penaeus monodon TaxID=6687 RepID=UPI0018A706C4|nr:uncharacterized protein LOC119569500 [Penaeus monodon]
MLCLRSVVLLAASFVVAMASQKCSRYCQTPGQTDVCCDPPPPPRCPTPLRASTFRRQLPLLLQRPPVSTGSEMLQRRLFPKESLFSSLSHAPATAWPHDTNLGSTVEQLRAWTFYIFLVFCCLFVSLSFFFPVDATKIFLQLASDFFEMHKNAL